MEIVYADDLNKSREFEHNVSVDTVVTEAKKCQTELHKWRKANQVSFDPAKEFVHIVSHSQPHGDSFKLLGVTFDCKLSHASWKLTTILRTRRFHEVTRLVQVYKSKILSFAEYRTPAVYHAARTMLARIDAIQKRFLRECCTIEEEALVFFNLAPLDTRRDVAMLGLIYRTVLGCGPRHFASMFRLAPPSLSQKHCWHLQSHRGLQNLNGGRAEERRSNAGRIAMSLEIQSSDRGRRLAPHLFTASFSA